MLVSFTLFNKGGLILYQHRDDPEVSEQSNAASINNWLEEVYTNPTKSLSERKASIDAGSGGNNHSSKIIVEWEETSELIALAIYPDLRHEDYPWIRNLLHSTLEEFQVFLAARNMEGEDEGAKENSSVLANNSVENQELFDKTFKILFKQHKNNNTSATVSKAKKPSKSQQTSQKAAKRGGKEKRQWHDGKAKVTKEAMAELDFSKETGEDADEDDNAALAEARAAYLPTDADLADFEIESTLLLDDEEDDDDSESSWGNSLKGLFQQVTGQKVLTKQDLEPILKDMHKVLTSKNVAADISQHICDNVQQSLVGKKLNSMYRVKTAVRQALEKAINNLLLPSTQLDLLRQVVSKRDAIFGSKRPYVIVVVGINGVGKSTSLAKLAYYLKTNGCKPLLAACDTFRSGAVEQLGVHAKCLELPIFHQGYAKDPSAVAKAAIEQATQNGNDVVLVDTAGRMQNNAPLMQALGKLAQVNQPDMAVFVGEALVGNDGVDQVKMFNKAIGSQSRNQKVNAILLTKFDTVSDKVGAALTMTHVTNAPILFVGTGQKYHHLQRLSTQSVIRSLFR